MGTGSSEPGADREREKVARGFLPGAVAMAVGGIAAIVSGVNAEGKTLGSIARPLSAAKRRAKSSAEVESGQEPPAAMV